MDIRKLKADLADELCRKSFKHFVRRFWHSVCIIPLVPARHIDVLADHCQAITEGEITQLVVNVPPGSGKSTVVSILWPAWEWLLRPKTQAIFASYGMSLSHKFSQQCRDLVDSDEYQRLIPQDKAGNPVWSRKKNPDKVGEFWTSAGGWRLCTSITGTGSGHRGHRVVVDDPINVSESYTEKELLDVISWWDYRMSNRMVDPARAQMLVIMQRVHENDLSGHCISQGDYELLCLPSEFDPDRRCKTSIFEDWRTEVGELLNPDFHTFEVLARDKRKLGSRGFAAQHQQRPSPKGGLIIMEQWFKKYGQLPSGPGTWLQSWDPKAGSKSKTSSYVVGQVWFRPQSQANCYLVDQVRERWNMLETVEAVKELSLKWPLATRKLMENKADGAALILLLNQDLGGMVPVSVKGSKEVRLEACSPQYEAGNVWVPGNAPWLDEHVKELTDAPVGRYDDQVDAASQALDWFRSHPSRVGAGIHRVPINSGGRSGSRKSQWV